MHIDGEANPERRQNDPSSEKSAPPFHGVGKPRVPALKATEYTGSILGAARPYKIGQTVGLTAGLWVSRTAANGAPAASE